MFTPTSTVSDKEKERVASKSVRINIDGDVTPTNPTTANGSAAYPRMPSQAENNRLSEESDTGVVSRRELSHGRKTMNRIPLGSNFYASIEPISLSNATPSTPKTRWELVRLPAHPQSVLIPSTAHHFPGAGSVNSNVTGTQLNSARLGAAGLQPTLTESFNQRRHKSQQLDMECDSPCAVPIPWQQLAPMGAQDNAKTFHGIGSAPSAPIPVLKKGGSQEDNFGGTILYPVNEAPEPRSSSHTPSWLLPALLESSSSFLFKKTTPSSAPSLCLSSPIRATFGLSQSCASSPTRILNNNTSSYSPNRSLASSSHLHHHPRQHSYRPSSFQTRKSFPITGSSSTSHHHYNDSFSSSSDNQTNASNSGDSLFKKSRRKLTASSTPTSFFSSLSSNNNNGTNTGNSNSNNNTTSQHQRSSVPVHGTTSTTKTSLWKRDSSAVLFPFSLVSYEYGGLLGEIKNTSTTICTNAPSSVVAPETPLPPGVIVSTGVPPLKRLLLLRRRRRQFRAVVEAHHHISFGSRKSRGSRRRGSNSSSSGGECESRTSTPTKRSHLASEVTQYRENLQVSLDRQEVEDGDDVNDTQDGRDSDDYDSDDYDNDGNDGEEDEDDEDEADDETDCSEEDLYAETAMNGSIVIQKSHVAVYEINAWWGSRMIMFLVTLGGIFCTLGGGLCAEHHCKDLQLCPDDYQAHGDWCGPSGVEGSPYMLTVGLSMCMFGLYAMTYLRSPISRLVGYSEIDQFL
ncbi:hypothetical protein BGX33_002165 [Mortierella sp. NVP41]|nr:hypothetical protein BGX33_002165 [Mortierella sp. NVP41]